MIKQILCILLPICILTMGSVRAYGQFSFLEEPHSMLLVGFMKEREEIDPSKSFFNVLKIENPTTQRMRFDVSFSLPAGWNLMGERTQSVLILPNETKLVPVRIAANVNTQGDIGYSIVAALKDNNGRVFKNVYSFVNVPKKNDISTRIVDRTLYLDPVLKSAILGISVINNGNVDELVFVNIQLPNTINIYGASNFQFKTDFIVRAKSDTTVNFDVQLKNTNEARELRDHRLLVETGTQDTTIARTIWARNIDSRYTLDIPMTDRVLVVELGAMNLFSQYTPIYDGAIWGNIRFSNNSNTEYFFRSMTERFYTENPWKYSRWHIRSRYKRFRLEVGDVNMPYLLSIFGRGAYASYMGKRMMLRATLNKNVLSEYENTGATIGVDVAKSLTLTAGVGYRQFEESVKEMMPTFGVKSKFLQNHYALNALMGYSISDYKYNNTTLNRRGLGGTADFNIMYPHLRWNNSLYFGENSNAGTYRGQMQIYSNLLYTLANTKSISAFYSGYSRNSATIYSAADDDLPYDLMHQLKILYQYQASPQVGFGIGPWFEYRGSNAFQGFNMASDKFNVVNPMLNAIARYRGKKVPININAEVRFGPTHVLRYDNFRDTVFNPIDTTFRVYKPQKNYINFYIALSARMRWWSFSAAYYDGPVTMSQHYSKFYAQYNTKTVRLSPALNLIIVKRLLEYSLRGNYTFDITARMNRLSISNELVSKIDRGWTLTLSNTIGHQVSKDQVTDDKYKYSNMYFEFRVRKEFGFRQPNFKYVDLNVVFFKDLNGNGTKDPDEPGVENVMTTIDRDYAMSDSVFGGEQRGEFYTMDFLSDQSGIVQYRNIPDGFYTIQYTPLGKSDNTFITESSSTQIYLDTKTQLVEIPFMERNKIFGQIVMLRNKISNLGTIELSNIKVTAIDSRGRMFSTLTDRSGRFVIYVPAVERYTVSINNIFREHFELEQNSFEVQLNGYKQFELTYIFTERQRRINFAQSGTDGSGQIMAVKRTNLSGSVKDATTFAAIKATVKVISSLTGAVVAETASDGRTGNFYLSYNSGENYRLDITADDYWFFSEEIIADQYSTFVNINRDVQLSAITVGNKITLNNVTFGHNSAELDEEAKIELSRVIEVLKVNPNIHIQIVGHCDDVEAITNPSISVTRAREVMNYLAQSGYTNVEIENEAGYSPLTTDVTEEARQINRRVEAVVINK